MWDDDEDFDYQGKREDQVTGSEVLAGVCLGLILIAVIGWVLLAFAGLAP